MIGLVIWLVFGWVAGSIAEWLWPPKVEHSRIVTIGIGVAGSVAGGLLGSIMGGSPYAPAGLVMSVLASLGLMWIYRSYIEGA